MKSDLTIYAGWLPGTTGEEPGAGERPGDQRPGQPTTPDPGRPGSGTDGSDLAQTGDVALVYPLVASAFAGLVSLGAGALILRRRGE